MTSATSIRIDRNGSDSWDFSLAELGGHPLQSAFWGRVRSSLEGISETRWVARQGRRIVWMARVEERVIPGVCTVAWIPRGPTVGQNVDRELIETEFRRLLKMHGYQIAVMTPWEIDINSRGDFYNLGKRSATIWVDLRKGRDQLLASLDKRVRYGIGRAERDGVIVSSSTDAHEVGWFNALCQDISREKGFNFPTSAEVIQWLIANGQSGAVQVRLFVGKHEGRLGAGALIMRIGRSVHYMFGGTDRSLSRFRIGEAVQWAIIEWALKEGCQLYDLEGIDPKNNPGTYSFKKKMGGKEIFLREREIFSFGLRGYLIKRFI